MTYTYQPRGVCSRKMTVQLQDGIIRDVRDEGHPLRRQAQLLSGSVIHCPGAGLGEGRIKEQNVKPRRFISAALFTPVVADA